MDLLRITGQALLSASASGFAKAHLTELGGGMAEMEQHAVLLKEIQMRFDRKLKENEISLLEYWKEHLDRVGAMKQEGIAALQSQVKNVSEMMANRIRILKRG
jgi:hypothetical protein